MSRQQIHGVHAREAIDKLALIAAFLTGATGTVFLKLLGAPALGIAAFPVAILMAYVLVCLANAALAIEPETVGDNCYYLGFLFTLTSLAVTLYQIRALGLDGGDDDGLIPLVISGFGVALTSTIAGVFLRVLLMQMRPDIVARDREARRDLAHGARDFNRSIAAVSRSLKTIAVETAQHARERNARLDEITEEHASRTRHLLADQAERFDSTLKTFATQLAEDTRSALESEIGAAMAALKVSSNELARTVSGITEARAAEETALRKARSEIAGSSEEFRQAMSIHREAIGAAIGETREQSTALIARIGEIAEAVERRQKELHAARAARVAETENRMKALVGETAEATRSFAATQRALKGLVAAIEAGEAALVRWPKDAPAHDGMLNGRECDGPGGAGPEAGRTDGGADGAVR